MSSSLVNLFVLASLSTATPVQTQPYVPLFSPPVHVTPVLADTVLCLSTEGVIQILESKSRFVPDRVFLGLTTHCFQTPRNIFGSVTHTEQYQSKSVSAQIIHLMLYVEKEPGVYIPYGIFYTFQ